MIIFISVNLKEILKKRKNTHGSVLTHAQIVRRIRYGDMAMYRYILIGFMRVSI